MGGVEKLVASEFRSYATPVKPRFVHSLLLLVAVCALSVVCHGQSKPIRLRNETINTAPISTRTATVQTLAADTPVSGLYLVQLTDRLQVAWRDQLRGLGVELIRFVPEDAFIARFSGTRLRQVSSLPFVRWVGPYRPELKVFEGLRTRLQNVAGTNRVPVSVLLAPGAGLTDVAQTGLSLKSMKVQSRTSFGSVVQARVNASELAALASSASVLWIEPTPRMKLSDEISSKIVAGGEIPENPGGGDGGDGGDPFGDLFGNSTDSSANVAKAEAPAPQQPPHPTATQQLGYDGRGVVVSVADSGLDNGDAETMHPDLAGRVDAFLYYGSLDSAADEHSHGTHVTGIIAGDGTTGEADAAGALYGLGVAPKAHIVVQRVFDAAGTDELPEYETLTRDAVRAGAVIGSNSWGDDVQGRYDLSAAQFDALVRDADAETPGEQPYILEFSAGNAGPGAQTLDSPAVGKNVIATGASENDRFDFFIYADGQDAMADFSSRGPCEDGRIKPDVVAPGTWIASLQSASASDENAWSPISANYQYQGGTSQAGPHVSGAAAVFVQYYRETHANATPSPALVKAALVNSAVDMDDSYGTGPIPNSDEGWGRVALTNLIGSNRHLEFVDQTEHLTTGQTYEHRILVASSAEPLKITLTYTDVPGLPAALPALVNDLDLEVVGPDGSVYRGNQFVDGESVAGASSHDRINNVEAVHLNEPLPGDYLVRVRARNVVEDVHHQTAGPPQQDFALVASGDLPLPGVGIVVLDRSAYTAPGVIQLKLIDTDLAGHATATVLLKSSTEPAGELITLQAASTLGVLTGAVATALGPAIADGKLQIKEGDTIEASYDDASPAARRTATALADLLPPLISGITVTNRYGKEVITWHTDEQAVGTVYFGTNLPPTRVATARSADTQPQVELQDLVPGATYYFYVAAADSAGNTSTDNNAGKLYSFVAKAAAAVLLVDAYVPDDPTFGTTDIPLSTYTDVLDQTGVTYEVWDLTDPTSPSPTVDDLRPFRVVIWRLSDSLMGNTTLTPAQQTALESYFNGGGGLFMASMEVLTRLGANSSFRTNVLQVRAFSEDVGVDGVYGEDNDPISAGMEFSLDYSAYNNDVLDLLGQTPNVADTLTLSTNAAPILFDSGSDHPVGLRFPRTGRDSAGRVVFLSFPFDALVDGSEAPNTRAALMRNILAFLAPGLGGWGTVTLDRAAYTLSDLMTIELADSDLAGQGRVTVNAYSTSMTNGVPVVLSETARRGLFRGTITLGAVGATGGNAQLRAKPGDSLWVQYLDASNASLVTARAEVDVTAPVISDIAVSPEFEEATVTWSTSEPTDGLVQFGESTFLGRTAYSGDFEETHELTLSGLQPDRIYYYQIVSRDPAGNTTVDSNGGKLYTFRTLKPLLPPWFDTLDGANTAASWSVENGEEGVATWSLGVPGNGLETEAHSPPNAWGSNLDGGSIDVADTLLVGPAINLTGGNVATLSFWHSYDFTEKSDSDIYEIGQVLISTNKNAAWVTLREYGEFTAGWEQDEIDLTPYLGHVVQLGWYYGFFTLEGNPRPGWVIDDVSVTVSNLVVGSIQLTNNLAQASFTLTGPVTRTGQGWSATLTNLPSGRYVLKFGDVPYYQTPPPQTNTISGNAVVVQGNYTFADVNNNGISDAWEQHYFGSVAASHPGATDTDGDGVRDLDEFLAGTDPTNAKENLELATPVKQSNGTCRITWAATPGHNYRLLASTNAVTWGPLSSWMRATSNVLSYSVPISNTNTPLFFRVEARP